jgi:hypothetical protein
VSFEVVPCGRWAPVDPLAEGEVSVCRSGVACFRTEDLVKAGIDRKPWAMVLADAGTLRVAVRAVRSGEEQQAVAVSQVTRKGGADAGRRRINLARAIRHCGLTTAAVAARYNLHVKTKDEGDAGLLIINLTDGPLGAKGQKRE